MENKLHIKDDIDALRTIRDELKLKAHLAKADLKDEWNTLEKKWERIEEELRRTTNHMGEPLHTISAEAKNLVEELKQRYHALVRHLD